MLELLRRRTALFWILVTLLVAGALPTFRFLAFQVNSDFHHHAGFIAGFVERGVPPLDFIYYGTVALLSGLSTDMDTLLRTTMVVMTVALLAKLLVTTVCLGRWLEVDPVADRQEWDQLAGVAFGILLLFCLPLRSMNWYLGQFPPNVWHNSTTMATMPFAVLLFFHASGYLETGRSRSLLPTTVYCALGLMTKPSVFFSFAPMFPLFALARFGWGKRFLQACIPVAFSGVLMLAYIGLVFFTPLYEHGAGGWQAEIGLGWLDVWRMHSSNVPLSIVNSVALPLLFLVCYPRECAGDLKIRFSAAMLAFGVLLFAVVQERGPWAISGNMSWQNIMYNYLLHCSVVVAFMRIKQRQPRFGARDWLLLLAFSAEAALGVLYILKIFRTHDYF
jgi:hypothetical protein